MEIPADWDHRPPPKFANPKRFVLFRPDRRSFQQFILSEQMRDPVTEVAGDMMLLAKSYTPRSSDAVIAMERSMGKGDRDGHLQDAYEVKREGGVITVGDAFPYPRVMVLIENNNGAAAAVEFGNSRSSKPGRRMLARAGAAFGDFKGGKG